MNKQEVFTKVKNHLLKQGEKAMVNDKCRYRTKNGLKCAIGCLIPDEKYTSTIEGEGVMSDRVIKVLPDNLSKEVDVSFLLTLQCIHDDYDMDDWEFELKSFADKHGLKYE